MGLRKLRAGLGMLLVGVLIFTGCKESSTDAGENTEDLGSFEYDGNSYGLSAGVAFDYGEVTEGFRNFDFILTEKAEDFNSESEEINSEHYIYFWLESKDVSSFSSGTFNFDASDEATEDHMYDGEIALNISSNGEEGDLILFTGGSVSIEREGNNFDFTFNATVSDGKSVTGSFSAELEIIDETDGSLEKRNGNKRALRFLNK